MLQKEESPHSDMITDGSASAEHEQASQRGSAFFCSSGGEVLFHVGGRGLRHVKSALRGVPVMKSPLSADGSFTA